MVPNSIPIPLPGGLSFELSKFVKIRQKFDPQHISDIDGEVAREFAKFADIDLKDKSVAIGVGSRGIKPQPVVVRAVVRELKAAGAKPFLVPTMGSHGGGVAKGQVAILEGYNLGEEFTGAPIRASMDVAEVGRLEDGTPVYCDRIAFEADYLIPCNRIKPHTDYRGPHESGLIKMMAIGMAKHKGAETLHRHGFAQFHQLLPAAARVFLDNTRVLFGIAMVENAYDDLRHVELVPPDEIFARDRALLDIAKANIPQLLIADSDEMALAVALRGCPQLEPRDAKIVRIANTLELSEIWVSQAVLADVEGNESIEIISDPFDAVFDQDGTWPLW